MLAQKITVRNTPRGPRFGRNPTPHPRLRRAGTHQRLPPALVRRLRAYQGNSPSLRSTTPRIPQPVHDDNVLVACSASITERPDEFWPYAVALDRFTSRVEREGGRRRVDRNRALQVDVEHVDGEARDPHSRQETLGTDRQRVRSCRLCGRA